MDYNMMGNICGKIKEMRRLFKEAITVYKEDLELYMKTKKKRMKKQKIMFDALDEYKEFIMYFFYKDYYEKEQKKD